MNALKPVCFMVMPFGTKKTDATAGTGPGQINFDALWTKALSPVITELGYEPVRADQDIGALIIHEMLERLYFSDLVIADMTVPNGNVYYEVGIRHACQRQGCVLIAADWAKPLFDIAQMRRLNYPLPEGDVTDATAQAIIDNLSNSIPAAVQGQSPLFTTLSGYPDSVDPERASTMRTQLAALSAFQQQIDTVRIAPKPQQADLTKQLIDTVVLPNAIPAAVHGVLKLLEDLGAWDQILNAVDKLPQAVRDTPDVIELINLARSKTGDHLSAIAALEALIHSNGATPEREGLIGGRYKKLHRDANNPGDKLRYLNQAIQHYERGMMLDLNEYYCPCNLPRLYRTRSLPEDEDKARVAGQATLLACQRARDRNTQDEWLLPTLLGAAFDAGDVKAAERLYQEMATQGIGGWKLDTTLADIESSLVTISDTERRTALQAVCEKLKQLGV